MESQVIVIITIVCNFYKVLDIPLGLLYIGVRNGSEVQGTPDMRTGIPSTYIIKITKKSSENLLILR